MPIIANGVTIDALYINGVLADDALANAVDVYDITQAQTDDPTSSQTDAKKFRMQVTFTNNDASSAVIYADINQATPTTSRGTVAGGGSVAVSFNGLDSGTSYTFYFYAIASGETASNIVSNSYSTT